MKLTAPYNFIPINQEIYIPEWGDKISHDIPFSDGEDGLINVTFINTTPLFIADASAKKTDNEQCFSAHYLDNNGRRQYFVPASSLKGAIRSVMEIMAFTRFDTFDDAHFGYRDFGGKQTTDNGRYVKMLADPKCKCGWLKYNKDENTYTLFPCKGFDKIPITEIQLANYNKKDNAIQKYEKFGCKYPVIRGKELICTGYMHNKKHEYLFHERNGNSIPLKEELIQELKSVYSASPYFDQKSNNSFCNRLNNGEQIPVFYIEDGNGNVAHLGFTRMFRLAFERKISDGVKQNESNGPDLCKCIFGHIQENGKSLKGRVQFSPAFAQKEVPDSELKEVSGVLGTPKASFYPLYLRQDSNRLNDYNADDIEIAGRKRYPIHSDQYITELPQGNDNEKTKSTLKPLPAGNTFTTSISLHNLRKVEIGALLSALTFHKHENTYHNLGMAKGYGYGKIKICGIKLKGLNYSADEYMKTFENEMNMFLKRDWIKTEQIQKLIGMAKEHSSDSGLEVMELKDYTEAKKQSDEQIFPRLPEMSESNTTSLISQEEKHKNASINRLNELQCLLNSGNIDEFENLYYKISTANWPEESITLLEALKKRSDAIKERSEQEKKEKAEMAKQNEETDKKRKTEEGLHFLEANDNGNYKIDNPKLLVSKLEQFEKNRRKYQYDLTETDFEILERTISRIMDGYNKMKPIEQKKLKNQIPKLENLKKQLAEKVNKS